MVTISDLESMSNIVYSPGYTECILLNTGAHLRLYLVYLI